MEMLSDVGSTPTISTRHEDPPMWRVFSCLWWDGRSRTPWGTSVVRGAGDTSNSEWSEQAERACEDAACEW